jgi:HEAT repeat protein
MRIALLFLFPLTLIASENTSIRRINAHLLVGDATSAVEEAQHALRDFSENPLIHEWLIKSLAALGEEAQMMEAWQTFHSRFKEHALEKELLEEICWGTLRKGRESGGITSQLICLIAAGLTHDMRALPFLLEGMHHTNAHIRTLAVELSAYYGDHPLREVIARLFREERVLDVRLRVIGAIGKLQMEEFLPDLIRNIVDSKIGEKETLATIEAILEMRDSLSKEELTTLATSQRSPLRQLACEVVSVCKVEGDVTLLLTPLMRDPQPDVCAAALRAWGILRKGMSDEIKYLASHARDPLVGVTAAWVWLLEEGEEGEEAMVQWLKHPLSHVRALAASAIGASGPYGIALAKKLYNQRCDPYVCVNLCLALARQREECDQVSTLLEEILHHNQEQWMLAENGLFQTLERSDLTHDSTIPNYPEVINQTVRLDLLNLLAILGSPGALEAIKDFLKERRWGVTGLAAETLLGEGDERAIELVRELLHDSDQDVRLEAALVLATWGKDSTTVPYLLEFYPKGDRQLQLKILESLGRIGNKETIPFLIERLKEPSQILRLIAASVLIQTLNH